MNPETGEIKQFPSAEEIPADWVPITNREARRLKGKKPEERMHALQVERIEQAQRRWKTKKKRLAARARARNRKNAKH